MTFTPHLALPLIDAAQAQKHVTHNEALEIMDALSHLAVLARDVTTPPASPAEGDRVIVGAAATGAFAGKDMQVAARLAGAWTFLAPQAGWRVYVSSESRMLVYDGAAWVDLGTALAMLQNLSLLGVGTTADATNPLSAKLNAALLTAKPVAEGGSGDLRVTLNKENPTRTVSQLYQSNYSGRAETGLTDDDNFHVKVSADGASWKDSVVIDRTTGAVAFPSGGPTKIVTFASSGVYTPSPGLRFADVLLVGAGGGGGSGARQAAGAIASGGGGGGGGGVARGRFTAAQIGASQIIAVGAGGAAGAAGSTNSSAGNNGGAGGATSFGSLLRANGGGGGAGGGLAVGSGGGAAGSMGGAGGSGSGASGGGAPFGGSAGGSAAAGGNSTSVISGSGGGGGSATGGAGNTGGVSFFGPSGGGAGGGITAANVTSAGGAGGTTYVNGAAMAAAGGGAGAAGVSGTNYAQGIGPLDQPGGGGGGGGSSVTTPGAGGQGGFPGGGGGGGGATQNGAPSGAGGAGRAGYAVIIECF